MFGPLTTAVLFAVGAAAAVGFGAAWAWQDSRHTAHIHRIQTAAAEARLRSEQQARQTEQYYAMQIRAAQADADKREGNLRRSIERNRAAVVGLRDTARDTAEMACHPAAPASQPATAIADVFGSCADALAAMAGAADGHTSDIRKLIRAWPATGELK